MVRLANEHLTVEVSSHGAELCSIRGNASGQEYLWQADPTYWKRHSPVLFPIVGSVWENQYRHADKSYPLSQHGFARDMDFELVSQSETEVLFRLESNEETLAKYFLNLSQLTFVGLVVGVVVPLYSDAGDARNWYAAFTGSLMTIIFALIGNKILK